MIRSLGSLQNVWRIPELRSKILYTLMILLVYRVGAHIPTPFINREALGKMMAQQANSRTGGLFAVIDMFSGGAFNEMSIFALGIMPYISVSIILQLLAFVYGPLQKVQQEGALGQRKINRLTRQIAIGLAAFQAMGIAITLQKNGLRTEGISPLLFSFTTVVAMTTGTAVVMWLGERITDQGIGNGISLIIAAGIIARMPAEIGTVITAVRAGTVNFLWIPVILFFFIVSVAAIILIQEGTRRIPMQQAKRQVGRRVLAGGTNYLPLKVNTANVIPVIFASALLSFPIFIASAISSDANGGFLGRMFAHQSPYNLYDAFGLQSGGALLLLKSFNPYVIMFAVLTAAFCFFYTAVAYNPEEVSNNLKKSGAFIPGKRPGKSTADYISYVLMRITVVGAIFLVLIALIPLILEISFQMPAAAHSFVGGTGLIIVIGVMLDLLRQIESQLLMRHYEGYAERRATSSGRWR